jgi:hypothetical protein
MTADVDRARLRALAENAIERIEESKDSHVRWRDHLGTCDHCTAHPPEYIQTKAEHEQIIAEYDDVLTVLRAVPGLVLTSTGIGSDTLGELERRDARWHTALRERNEARAALDALRNDLETQARRWANHDNGTLRGCGGVLRALLDRTADNHDTKEQADE